jgi:hypothetical protein
VKGRKESKGRGCVAGKSLVDGEGEWPVTVRGPKEPLTRSGRRFVSIQFQARSGLIANWAISFLVVAPSSFG